MPTLVLHGRRDPAVPLAAVTRYLSRVSPVTHVILPGDHFVLLTRELRVRRSISRFLASRLAHATR